MPAKKNSPQSSTRSTPRSSPRSTKSTPTTSKRASKLRQSTTPSTTRPSKSRPSTSNGQPKSSPYFAKTGSRPSSGRGKKAAKTGSDLDSATGLTETDAGSSSADEDSEDAFDPSEDDEAVSEAVESELDSDALDEENDDEDEGSERKGKRKSVGGSGGVSTRKKQKTSSREMTKSTQVKSSGKHTVEGYEDEDEDDEVELEEGQEIAGRIYPAPKTGQVRPGRISQNTLNFLKNLLIPERNDRDWFRSHEPAFRQAEKEWQAFVGLVQQKFHEADAEVPILPPKDMIHRIYRDVRFSSDKTPYKRSFSMTTSRGGRKSLWAGYHFSVSPNNHSIIACGIWQPAKNELSQIRHHILTEPQTFRDIIEAPDFVRLFGPAKPGSKGKRQNVFGHEDALKMRPNGIDKNHKDIDLLKLRTVSVVHHFTDEEVVAKDFQEKVKDVVAVMAPFVHMLNDFCTIPSDQGGNGDGGRDQNGDNGGDAEEDGDEEDE